MPESGVRIMASPSEDGSTINDEITCADQSRLKSLPYGEHEECLM